MMWVKLTAVIAMMVLGADVAQARKSKRTGLNFGANLRVVTDNNRSNASDKSPVKSDVTSAINSVAPYVGFVAGRYLNIGVAALMDRTEDTVTEFNESTGNTLFRHRSVDVKAMSLFSRFLFADVMFFEASAGVYEQNTTVFNESTSPVVGAEFTGSREEYKVRGLGTGYSLGAGLELPIVNGFYFSSAYNMRAYQLRDYNGNGDLGKKLSRVERKEFTFGIAHYVK